MEKRNVIETGRTPETTQSCGAKEASSAPTPDLENDLLKQAASKVKVDRRCAGCEPEHPKCCHNYTAPTK